MKYKYTVFTILILATFYIVINHNNASNIIEKNLSGFYKPKTDIFN